MAIGIILAVIFIGGVVGAIVFGSNYKGNNKLTKIACIALIAVAAVGFITLPLSFHTISAGNVAVVKHLGKIKTVRSPGTYFDFWMTNGYQKYDTKVQKIDMDAMTYSSDAQVMDIQLTVQYQVKLEKVKDIAEQFGKIEQLQDRIISVATEKTKSVLSAYKAMDIIAKRAEMSPAVEKAVKAAIGDEYYVTVVTVVLTNIDFSDEFEKSVEEKMVAEQKQLKAEYDNKTKIANAEADAKAKIVAAEAEARANELKEKSLTEKILRDKYITKWNGVLPNTVAGDQSTIMIPAYQSGE